MSEKRDPVENQGLNKRLVRAQIIVTALVFMGIGLFFVLWTGLGNAGVDSFPQLIISFCVPPTLIAALVGFYFLFAPRKDNP